MNSSITKQTTCYLMFSAMSEIMLSMESETSVLNTFDESLHLKLKNLKANFERTTKRAHSIFDEREQLIFYHMITVFEKLIEKALNLEDFHSLMGLIEAWENDDLTMINNSDQLISIAELAKEKKSIHAEDLKSKEVETNGL
jgi:hypothetical protein